MFFQRSLCDPRLLDERASHRSSLGAPQFFRGIVEMTGKSYSPLAAANCRAIAQGQRSERQKWAGPHIMRPNRFWEPSRRFPKPCFFPVSFFPGSFSAFYRFFISLFFVSVSFSFFRFLFLVSLSFSSLFFFFRICL